MGRGTSGSNPTARQAKPKIQTMDEFLGTKGVRSPISDYLDDKWKVPHGMTASQAEKYQKEAQAAAKSYSEKREAAQALYKALVKSGKIVPPSKLQAIIKTASGHPDNQATIAARRLLEKRFHLKYSEKLAKRVLGGK